MLSRRLLSAAVIISVLLGLIYVDFRIGTVQGLSRPGVVLSAISVLLAMMSAYELVQLFQNQLQSTRWLEIVGISGVSVAICCAPVAWENYPPDCAIGMFGWSMMAMTFAVGMTLLIEIIRFQDNGQSSSKVAGAVLIHAQLILLFGFLIGHRLLFHENSTGLIALIALLTAVKTSDAAAYFAVKSLGKNKLAPSLSPGKTVEGLCGSFFGAFLGLAIVVYLVAPFIFEQKLNISVGWAVTYAIAVTIAGVVGDLAESMFKRDAKIKDSSSWLPGLGGILDITDSLVFAAPVSYFLWVLTR